MATATASPVRLIASRQCVRGVSGVCTLVVCTSLFSFCLCFSFALLLVALAAPTHLTNTEAERTVPLASGPTSSVCVCTCTTVLFIAHEASTAQRIATGFALGFSDM